MNFGSFLSSQSWLKICKDIDENEGEKEPIGGIVKSQTEFQDEEKDPARLKEKSQLKDQDNNSNKLGEINQVAIDDMDNNEEAKNRERKERREHDAEVIEDQKMEKQQLEKEILFNGFCCFLTNAKRPLFFVLSDQECTGKLTLQLWVQKDASSKPRLHALMSGIHCIINHLLITKMCHHKGISCSDLVFRNVILRVFSEDPFSENLGGTESMLTVIVSALRGEESYQIQFQEHSKSQDDSLYFEELAQKTQLFDHFISNIVVLDLQSLASEEESTPQGILEQMADNYSNIFVQETKFSSMSVSLGKKRDLLTDELTHILNDQIESNGGQSSKLDSVRKKFRAHTEAQFQHFMFQGFQK